MKRTKLSFEDRLFIESIIVKSLAYSEVWIDFFCGFGGVTHGIERTKLTAKGIATVIACLNHDENAIGSHKLSHPQCYHITEDIRSAYTDILKYMVREVRRRSNNKIKVKLWFSHECTHYSIAKGGDSRDADSRSLPEELHRYIDDLQPDAVWIENVREFLTWGPLIQKTDNWERPVLREDGTPWMIPDPDHKGEYFDIWRDSIIAKGFKYDYRFLNCADYGCPTIRKRVFIQFLKVEKMVWAEPTHAKDGKGGLPPWIPIKACLNREDKGTSIFEIKKSGKPRIASRKTFKRLYEGCKKILEPLFEKAVAEYQMTTIYYGNGMNNSVDVPANTLTTKDRISLVSTEQFLTQYYGSGDSTERNRKTCEPSPALTTNPRERVISADFISLQYSGDNKNQSTNKPCSTITTVPHERLVTAQFITRYYGNDVGQNQRVDEPAGTISTVPKERLVSPQFIDRQYGMSNPGTIDEPANTLTNVPKLSLVSGQFISVPQYKSVGSSIDEPSPTVLACNKTHYVVDATPFLMNTNYNNPPTSIEDPSPVITANRKRHYVINMQFNNTGHSIEDPSPTLVAKMDKKPNYLITTEEGKPAIEIFDTDFPEVVLIKQFMAKWGISDIFMRELRIPEMLKIHTMPPDLPMVGSLTERKKFIGNQVPAQIVTELILGSWYGNSKEAA